MTQRVITFGKQDEFVHSTTPYVALISGVGGGKTRGGALKTLKFFGENPGALGIVTSPTYKMLSQATIRTYLEVLEPYIVSYHKGEQLLQVRGGELLFRSTEDPETLRGPNLGFFHMDEPALSPHAAFLILQGRLRQPGMKHQGWLTGTPKGYNWVYQEFVAQRRLDYQLINYPARENPFLPPDFLRHLGESYRGEFALQEIEGAFVLVGGECLFNLDTLTQMLGECRVPIEPPAAGWSTWKLPVVGRHYVAGLDTATGEAGAGGSRSASVVVDCQTGEVVASFQADFLPDAVAEAVAPVWTRYHALACPERMGPAGQWAIHKLEELGYTTFFYEDGPTRRRPGLTMGANRGELLLALEEAIRRRECIIYDRALIDQMFTFVRGKDGKFRAAEGARDDIVMALALGWYVRQERDTTWSPPRRGAMDLSRMVTI